MSLKNRISHLLTILWDKNVSIREENSILLKCWFQQGSTRAMTWTKFILSIYLSLLFTIKTDKTRRTSSFFIGLKNAINNPIQIE